VGASVGVVAMGTGCGVCVTTPVDATVVVVAGTAGLSLDVDWHAARSTTALIRLISKCTSVRSALPSVCVIS
jgi:hypothetical protein